MNRSPFAGAVTACGLLLLASAAAGLPDGPLRRVQRGEALAPCPQPSRAQGPGAEYIAREHRGDGFTVDACGRVVSDAGEWLPSGDGRGPAASGPPGAPAGGSAATLQAVQAAEVTIDRMATEFSFASHDPAGPIVLVGSASAYELSNGDRWTSGAGGYTAYGTSLDHVETSGTTLRYVLARPGSGLIYDQTDFDSGDHSAQGRLGPAGALVLVAEQGSTTAVLRGNAVIVSNDATWYGEPRFNYYTAIVGSVVPFEMVYTLEGGGTWTADAFSHSFTYSVEGFVDFAHPVSTPPAVALQISGPSRIPDESMTPFRATVRYENGVEREVSSRAEWTVDPAAVASVAGGVVTVGTLQVPEVLLTLRAASGQGADRLVAEKPVRCLMDDPAEKPGTWPMFQANARHTGHLEIALDPTTLQRKWQRDVGGGRALNPVAAGDGEVFVTLLTYFDDVPSLFALRGRDGATLWSKGFGEVFSVNPPSYAYGNVYVQTGNHAGDTWLRAYAGDTGDAVFQAPHGAQWERYFAPTLFEGKAYINGGYFGGMYSFDAYSGAELWFADLQQYDEWTPAVDAGRAYAYVGEYAPGLYGRDRATGGSSLFVPDPNFDWNGWSMELAPVLGDHDDLIAIHDGRLLSFDTAQSTIRWEVASQFAGQPSLAHDRIYAIDNGRLRVLDELTHAELWSWTAPDGDLAGPMIVTDTHLFVSTGQSVHAVDLTTHQSVWSYPVAGHLAIADGTLYVASADGKLTAFAPPPALSFYTVPPCRVVDTRRVSGPEGGPALSGGVARLLHLAGRCGVPATARALSANITVTGPGAAGHLSLGGPGGEAPASSTINYAPGQTRANNAVIPLDPAGDLTVLANQGAGTAVHLIVDVNGYFE